MIEPDFKVGDIVEIREASFLKTQRNVFPSCMPAMIEKYAGRTTTITEVSSTNPRYSGGIRWIYRIEADRCTYVWNGDWFVTTSSHTPITPEVSELFDSLL